MRFVFTGRAIINGQFRDRELLVARANQCGQGVFDSVSNGVDVLVASRSDTSKAVAARALGKVVWTYDQLNIYLTRVAQGASESAAYADATAAARASAAARVPVAAPVPSMGTRAAVRAAIARRREAQIAPEPPKKVTPPEVDHVLSNRKRAIDL